MPTPSNFTVVKCTRPQDTVVIEVSYPYNADGSSCYNNPAAQIGECWAHVVACRVSTPFANSGGQGGTAYPVQIDLNPYLLTSTAATTYLTQPNAASTYLTQADFDAWTQQHEDPVFNPATLDPAQLSEAFGAGMIVMATGLLMAWSFRTILALVRNH